MKPEAVIFDLDDTLLVQEDLNRDLMAEMMEHVVPGLSQDKKLQRAGDFLALARDLWSRLESNPWCRIIGISSGEGLFGEFAGDTKELRLLRREAQAYRLRAWEMFLEKGPEFFGDFWIAGERDPVKLARLYLEKRRAMVRWLPFAREVLDYLEPKVPLALLTNGAPDLQWHKIRGAGLQQRFKVIVVSGEVGIGKPDPSIFHQTLDQLGVPAEKAVMVGNNPRSDITGAQRAGIPQVWLDWEGDTLPEGTKAWKTLKTMEGLPALLGF